MNLAELITRQRVQRPDAPAVLLADQVISYETLDAMVWNAADKLLRMNAQTGKVLAISMRSQFLTLVAMLATARIGAVAFSLPRTMPVSQREWMAAKAGVTHLLSDEPDQSDHFVPNIQINLDELMQLRTPPTPAAREFAPEAPFLLISGSGSTGTPKIFGLSHAQMLSRARQTAASIRLGPEDRILSVSSLDFTSPKERCMAALAAGAAVAVIESDTFNPVSLCRDLGITVMNATVYHLENMLSKLPDDALEVLGSLRVLQVGASTVSDSLRRRVVQKICKSLHVRYGTNETGLISIAYPNEMLSRPGNVGRPWSQVMLEIVDDGGQPLPADQTGHIRVKSPGMVHGYLDDAPATESAFRNGWFYTGDIGTITREGQLLHLGRSDHMMITNGVNIYPAEIERIIALHPAVRDVAALPLKSEIHQDIPVCAVTIDPAQQITEKTLLAFARERLGSRAPVAIAILDFIPRNGQGKLIRSELARGTVEKLKAKHVRSTERGAVTAADRVPRNE